VNAQIVSPEDSAEGPAFRFRHALTREGVLEDLLPPERAELAARAAEAIQRAHPGLPGPWCERAAELRELAGERKAAALLLLESAAGPWPAPPWPAPSRPWTGRGRSPAMTGT
jgi:hypothetical protein